MAERSDKTYFGLEAMATDTHIGATYICMNGDYRSCNSHNNCKHKYGIDRNSVCTTSS